MRSQGSSPGQAHDTASELCVAVASTVAAAALTSTPSIDGFTDAFTVFTVVAAVAAVLSLRLVPSGKPQMTGARTPTDPAWVSPNRSCTAEARTSG
jgi:hypothetical protein